MHDRYDVAEIHVTGVSVTSAYLPLLAHRAAIPGNTLTLRDDDPGVPKTHPRRRWAAIPLSDTL